MASRCCGFLNRRKLVKFEFRILVQFSALAGQFCGLRVRLRADRHIFPSGHRHGASEKARHACQQDVVSRGGRSGDPDNEACRRHDPVVRAKYGGSQPADAMDEVVFGVRGTNYFEVPFQRGEWRSSWKIGKRLHSGQRLENEETALRSNKETDDGRKDERRCRNCLTSPIQGLLKFHSRYGPSDCSNRPRRHLSRGFNSASCPAKSLVSYQINRQLSGWNLPPL